MRSFGRRTRNEHGRGRGFVLDTCFGGQGLGGRGVFWRDRGNGLEWEDECLVEIVAVAELIERVGIVFAEDLLADHVEDDVAEVLAGIDVPVMENGEDHRAEFLEGEKADAIEELSGGNVLGKRLPAFFLLLDREVERVADKRVNLPVIAGVFRQDSINCLRKADFLHSELGKGKPSNVMGREGSVNCGGRGGA